MSKYILKTNESGDWKILYKELLGRQTKLIEGHSFSTKDLFEVLELHLQTIEVSDEEMERICNE